MSDDDDDDGDPWSKLCVAIASLEPNCTELGVQNKLQPLLADAKALTINGSISPLLVASDKGNLPCLQYLSKFDSALVGSPTTPTSEAHGANTPVHHAAMAGCAGAWPIFVDMIQKKEDDTIASIYARLGSLANNNGDTPLQMAVPAGNFEFVQQFWLGGSMADDNKVNNKQVLQDILQQPNLDGDTCASLACCHGHVDILDFLITECCVLIKHEEVEACQTTVDRMDAALATVTDQSARASFQDKQARVHACLTKLQNRLHQQVEEAAQDLLLDNTTVGKEDQTAANKKKSKKKKKLRTTNKKHQATNESITTNEARSLDDSSCVVSRLEDGRVAVTVQAQDDIIEEGPMEALLRILPSNPTTAASAQSMLRQRLKDNTDKDVDAVMDALCLDVSMLLYTPHGMALNLSPSQLDAVEQILQKQSQAVREARGLQQRMHPKETISTESVDNSNDKSHNDY